MCALPAVHYWCNIFPFLVSTTNIWVDQIVNFCWKERVLSGKCQPCYMFVNNSLPHGIPPTASAQWQKPGQGCCAYIFSGLLWTFSSVYIVIIIIIIINWFIKCCKVIISEELLNFLCMFVMAGWFGNDARRPRRTVSLRHSSRRVVSATSDQAAGSSARLAQARYSQGQCGTLFKQALGVFFRKRSTIKRS